MYLNGYYTHIYKAIKLFLKAKCYLFEVCVVCVFFFVTVDSSSNLGIFECTHKILKAWIDLVNLKL